MRLNIRSFKRLKLLKKRGFGLDPKPLNINTMEKNKMEYEGEEMNNYINAYIESEKGELIELNKELVVFKNKWFKTYSIKTNINFLQRYIKLKNKTINGMKKTGLSCGEEIIKELKGGIKA